MLFKIISFNGVTTMKVAIILFAIVMIGILVMCFLLLLANSGAEHYPDIKDL